MVTAQKPPRSTEWWLDQLLKQQAERDPSFDISQVPSIEVPWNDPVLQKMGVVLSPGRRLRVSPSGAGEPIYSIVDDATGTEDRLSSPEAPPVSPVAAGPQQAATTPAPQPAVEESPIDIPLTAQMVRDALPGLSPFAEESDIDLLQRLTDPERTKQGEIFNELRIAGRNPETEQLLRLFYPGIDDQGIASIFTDRNALNKAAAAVFKSSKGFKDIAEWAMEEPDQFIRNIQKKGRNADTELLLRALGLSEEDIASVYEIREVPEGGQAYTLTMDGVEVPATVDKDFNVIVNDQVLGKFDPATQGFIPNPGNGALTEQGDYKSEGFFTELWNATQLGAVEAAHATKQFFVSTLPNKLWPDVKEGSRKKVSPVPMISAVPEFIPTGAKWTQAEIDWNRSMRDKFRAIYAKGESEHQAWLEKHTDLQPPQEYNLDITQNLGLLKDPGYWGQIIGQSATFSIAVMGTTLAVSFATKNPFLGLAAGTAIATPMQAQQLRDALLAAGAPEDQIDNLVIPIGSSIALVESVTDLPLLKALSPAFDLFKRELTTAVVRSAVGKFLEKAAVKAGVKTVEIMAVEALEETMQGAMQNATVKMFKKDQAIFEDWDETIIKTLIATGPMALFGGASVMRRATAAEVARVSDAEKKAQGWKLMPVAGGSQEAEGAWFKPDDLGEYTEKLAKEYMAQGLSEDEAVLKAINEAARTQEGEAAIRKVAGGAEEEVSGAPVTPIQTLADLHLHQARGHFAQGKSDSATIANIQDFIAKLEEVQQSEAPQYEGRMREIRRMVNDGDDWGNIGVKADNLLSDLHKLALTTNPQQYEQAQKTAFTQRAAQATPAVKQEPGAPEAGLQPGLIEGVRTEEVRPKGKSKTVQVSMEDQLKLEEARRVAGEQAPAEEAVREPDSETEAEVIRRFEEMAVESAQLAASGAEAELEALRDYVRNEPATKYLNLLRKTGKLKGEIGNITVKQFRDALGYAPRPSVITKDGKHVRWTDALDQIATELGYQSDEAFKNAVEKVKKAQIKIEQLERDLPGLMAAAGPVVETPKAERVKAKQIKMPEILDSTTMAPEQVENALKLMSQFLASPNTQTRREATVELRKHFLARKAQKSQARVAQLIIEGVDVETAIGMAKAEIMPGKQPLVTSEDLAGLSEEVTAAMFARVYERLSGDWFALMETADVLRHALATGDVPRVRPVPPEGGFKSKIWPQGASAWDKLNYVFGDQPLLVKALTQEKPMKDWLEAEFREPGQPPQDINEELADYLRSLPPWQSQQTLDLELTGGLKVTLTYEPTGNLGLELGGEQVGMLPREYTPLNELPQMEADTRTAEQKVIDLQNLKLEITPDTWEALTTAQRGELSYLRINLLKTEYQAKLFEAKWAQPPSLNDIRNDAEREYAKRRLELTTALLEKRIDKTTFDIEMAVAEEKAHPPPASDFFERAYDPGVAETFTAPPMIPVKPQLLIIRAFKELGSTLLDIGNALRAVKASFDFSFWRQVAPLIVGSSDAFLVGNVLGWKGMWSEAVAEAEWNRISKHDPLFQFYEQGPDFLRPRELPKGTKQYKGVEEYGFTQGQDRPIPKFVNKIPFVKVSQRGFVTAINAMLWFKYKQHYKLMLKVNEQYATGKLKLEPGETFNIQERMNKFASFLADFSGRAEIGHLGITAPAANALFFSLRLNIGRILSPRHLISSDKYVRIEAWKNALSFVSTIGGIMVIGALAGLWDIEDDPISTDYMKIRIGNTRVDPWGGYQQFVVLVARMWTKTGLVSATGKEYPTDPSRVAWNFLRTKGAPLVGLFSEAVTGKTFFGDPVDVKNLNQWIDRLAPFAVQDIYEAFTDNAAIGTLVSIPAIVGAGVQTYSGKWEDNIKKLGQPKYSDNLPYGIKDPAYTTQDFWADHADDFSGVDPSELTKLKGFSPVITALAEALAVRNSMEQMPNQQLTTINVDPMKGLTLSDFYNMWLTRQRITGEKELKAYDADEQTRNAYLGNMTQRQYTLLQEYHDLPKELQKQFLADNPEIDVHPRQEYLRTHPEENAKLAIWGKAKVLTQEAYDKAMAMLKQLDIPDNAIVDSMPPKALASDYFKLAAEDEKWGSNSWESKLILAKNPDLVQWMKGTSTPRQAPSDTVAELELRVKYRPQLDQLAGFSDRDSEFYIADEQARAKARDAFLAQNGAFRDAQRKIAVYDQFGSEEYANWNVEMGRLADSDGPVSPSVKLYKLEHPDFLHWGIGNGLWSDNLEGESIGALRLQVKHKATLDQYNGMGDTNSKFYIRDPQKREDARKEFRLDPKNATFNDDLRRIDIYEIGGAHPDVVSAYVEYGKVADQFGGASSEARLFKLDHPDLYAFGQKNMGWSQVTGKEPVMRIDVAWRKQDEEYEALTDPAKREAYLLANPAYQTARFTRDAYSKGFEEKLISQYVEYFSIPRAGYANERYLMEHQEFYTAAGALLGWQPIDFSKVPTRRVEGLYLTYLTLEAGSTRMQYRLDNPELDEWLVMAKGYSAAKAAGATTFGGGGRSPRG